MNPGPSIARLPSTGRWPGGGFRSKQSPIRLSGQRLLVPTRRTIGHALRSGVAD